MLSFKQYLDNLDNLGEKVSTDCSTGAGVIPHGKYHSWDIVRTSHLDDPRNPPDPKQRDDNFDCDSFNAIVSKLLQKRPINLKDGDYQLKWKNSSGYQSTAINVNNKTKKIVFKTIIQMNKRYSRDYHAKSGQPSIDLGVINEPG